jgi:hypothetical protein
MAGGQIEQHEANSPPWHSAAARLRADSPLWPVARASAHSTAAFDAIRPSTAPTMRTGLDAIKPRSTDMPTEMKNRPSNRPLNGWMFASSSWRYSESASSTPARKAPSDMDSPTPLIRRDTPITTSNAAAVKISWILDWAMRCSTGRSSRRPPATTAAMTASASAAESSGSPLRTAPGPSRGTNASSGMTDRSWNSRMANAERP